MQGQKGVIGSLPENLALEHGSDSSDFATSSSSDPFERRKRKAVELDVGQSSSENPSPDGSMPADAIIPRLGLGVNAGSSDDHNVDNTRRNVRIRISSSRQQDRLPASEPVDLQSPTISLSTTAENSWSNEASRRPVHLSSRLNRSSSSRAHRSANIAVSGDTSRTMLTSISEHPIFFQPRNDSNENHITSAYRGPCRRLSEILHRSLLSSRGSGAGGGQNGNLFSDRHGDPVFGFPYLAADGSEGRGRLASEVRIMLDAMRRGEGLRMEHGMLFHGIRDRHRDMRLDIDNMSYEELLALEERIGNVNTGLFEETISSCVKQGTYAGVNDTEPCCVCQEEYSEGDDLGSLECGHRFHRGCIKQWLLQKNLCPVCKSAAKTES